MIEDRLSGRLLNKEYKVLHSNVEGVYLFYRTTGDESTIISVVHALNGEEFTVEQYKHMLVKIKANFIDRGLQEIYLLSLIFTLSPGNAKQFCLEEDEHWIIDLNSNQLIIYETQSSDFMGLRGELENMLEEELNYQKLQGDTKGGLGYENSSFRDTVQNKTSKIRVFTLMNTIIIGINIIAYLVMYHTDLFGGTDQMIRKGGIFWYYVIENKEYYRILTSLFMHSGIEHLLNNMIVLLFVGANLERVTGKLKYLLLYFGTGIIADISSIVYNMVKDKQGNEIKAVYSIGASGAIFGIVGAMIYIIIVNKGRLEGISSRQIILFAIFGLYGGIINVGIDNAAHIGGILSGVLLAILLYRRPKIAV